MHWCCRICQCAVNGVVAAGCRRAAATGRPRRRAAVAAQPQPKGVPVCLTLIPDLSVGSSGGTLATGRALSNPGPETDRGAWSSHRLHGARLDLVHHPHVARLGERVFVLAEVFLGERVDMGAGALLDDAPYPAADLHVAIGIVG